MSTQKVADGSVVFGWLGWTVSHITQINGVLQALLLITSIVATLIAARYHYLKTPK